MSSFRVSGRGRVDHTQPIQFTFDGKKIKGFKGDTWHQPCWPMAFT